MKTVYTVFLISFLKYTMVKPSKQTEPKQPANNLESNITDISSTKYCETCHVCVCVCVCVCVWLCMCVCVCVTVYVCERGRERESSSVEKGNGQGGDEGECNEYIVYCVFIGFTLEIDLGCSSSPSTMLLISDTVGIGITQMQAKSLKLK